MDAIRNFVIVSHIDHGKSTLADRLIEYTGTVPKEKIKPQMLDSMDLERERGITIKMAPVRMMYHSQIPISRLRGQAKSLASPAGGQFQNYILNLIDTPGHVDFSYEVSRALACVEGAVLLVDATKGIQAQTLSNFHMAQKAGLTIIPVVNKIDLPTAQVEAVSEQLVQLVGDSIAPLHISAKSGEGIDVLLQAIIEHVLAPTGDAQKPLRALIFDSIYDEHRGVIAYVRIIDGTVTKGEKITLVASDFVTDVLEIGTFGPERTPQATLSAGAIGYIVTSAKSLTNVRVGDTITEVQSANFKFQNQVQPIAGFQKLKPMVFASVFPVSSDNAPLLRRSLEKLQLNDASLVFQPTQSQAFGPGFRLGCLGLLHLEIIKERLEREFGLELVVTTPSVAYRGNQEPFLHLEVITPAEYLGAILELINRHRGTVSRTDALADRIVIAGMAPLAEIIADFYDELKSISRGYATMDYELADYRDSDLVQLDILVADEPVEPFSQTIHRSKIQQVGRRLVERLKDLIPRRNFEVKIQAAVGGKIIASERIPPLRKDVTAKLYGGDVTRKRKLLEKQKAGKARMKQFGRVEIPSEVFLNVLKRS
ncbi:elongation factor 4 [Candidatus Berkelbacteria bacterium]|nr:elongation factor 4 [Candidatus Berkelbacteria bacterium]